VIIITFGGATILAGLETFTNYPLYVSPLYVSPLCSVLSDSYAKLYRSASLWVDEFQMIVLDDIMR